MKPPLLSGRRIVKAFLRLGYRWVDQRGSHIKLTNDSIGITVIVADHKEVDRWTLKGILKDAEISVEEFLKFVR